MKETIKSFSGTPESFLSTSFFRCWGDLKETTQKASDYSSADSLTDSKQTPEITWHCTGSFMCRFYKLESIESSESKRLRPSVLWAFLSTSIDASRVRGLKPSTRKVFFLYAAFNICGHAVAAVFIICGRQRSYMQGATFLLYVEGHVFNMRWAATPYQNNFACRSLCWSQQEMQLKCSQFPMGFLIG